MCEINPYPNGHGVEQAIKEAAKKASHEDPSLSVNERIRLKYFNRFLSRVFSEGDESGWVLKGGTGMLARVPSARATLDIDLYRREMRLDSALEDLRRLVSVDLGDHFRFQYTEHSALLAGEDQPYMDGVRVAFNVFIGVRKKGALHVDLTVGAGVTAEITRMPPAGALSLPRLVSNEYRLYPVVDQIADKICATIQKRGERSSTREKDLVDLVVLAITQDVDGRALSTAITEEFRRRQMDSLSKFVVPENWGPAYRKQASRIPSCAKYLTVDKAQELMTKFINPVLSGEVQDTVWSHAQQQWKDLYQY